jgi:hypothetical protein
MRIALIVGMLAIGCSTQSSSGSPDADVCATPPNNVDVCTKDCWGLSSTPNCADWADCLAQSPCYTCTPTDGWKLTYIECFEMLDAGTHD